MSAKKRKLNQLHDSTVLCQVIKERLAEVIKMKKAGAITKENGMHNLIHRLPLPY